MCACSLTGGRHGVCWPVSESQRNDTKAVLWLPHVHALTHKTYIDPHNREVRKRKKWNVGEAQSVDYLANTREALVPSSLSIT